MVISTNEELGATHPMKKGIVRANAPIGGWILIPDKNVPNKTHCSLFLEVDFGGYMPDIAVNTAFRQQGYQINLLKKTLPKFLEKFKNKL